jgi:hypothetical protein
VCGPERAVGDGLRIFPGWLPERSLAAAEWIPDETLADGAATIAPEFVWAVLDCTGSFPLLEPPEAQALEPMVLGRLAVDLARAPRAGEACLVTAWSLGLEGRRGRAGSALFAGSELLARGLATWVSLAGRP